MSPPLSLSDLAVPSLIEGDAFGRISTDEELAARVREAAQGSEQPYRDLMHRLIGTPADFDEAEAAAMWQEAVQRRRELRRALGRPVHMRTAIMDLLYGPREHAKPGPRPVLLTKRLVQELLRSSFEDALTGAVNRARFVALVEHELAQRVRRELVVGFADLDGFKAINDVEGHAAGDAILVKFVRAAKRALRTSDVVARFGGDEFAFLLLDCRLDEVPRLATRMRECFADALRGAAVTFSVGWTTPKKDDDAASLIRRADEHMYKAKRGRARPTRRGGTQGLELREPMPVHLRRLAVALSDDAAEVAALQRALAEDGHPLLPARDLPTATRLIRLARPRVVFVGQAFARHASKLADGSSPSSSPPLIAILRDPASASTVRAGTLAVSPKAIHEAPPQLFAALGPPSTPLPRMPVALARRILEAVAARLGGERREVPSGSEETVELSIVASLLGH